MHHPLSVHTNVRVIIPDCQTCGTKRWIQINSRIVKVEKNNGEYHYTITTGDIVPYTNILQVI